VSVLCDTLVTVTLFAPMFESGALHDRHPLHPSLAAPRPLAVRGVTAAWLAIAAVLIVVGMWLQHSHIERPLSSPSVSWCSPPWPPRCPWSGCPVRWAGGGRLGAIVLVLGIEPSSISGRSTSPPWSPSRSPAGPPPRWPLPGRRYRPGPGRLGRISLAVGSRSLRRGGHPGRDRRPVAVKVLSGHGADRARFDSVAYTDFLTNCPNRRALVAELPHRLEAARHRDTSLAVAVIDLDRFGSFNEDWGHAAGDRLLTDVATVLRFTQRSDPEAPASPTSPGSATTSSPSSSSASPRGCRRAHPRRGDRSPRRLHGQRRDRLLGSPRDRGRPHEPLPPRARRRRQGPWAEAGWWSTRAPALGRELARIGAGHRRPQARSNPSTSPSAISAPAA
jgi:hypothetical protein